MLDKNYGADNKMDNYVFRDISVADKCFNPFINLILRVRGSKKLFSSSENAEKYLVKINGRRESIELHGKFRSRIHEFYCGSMQCFSFRQVSCSEKTVIYLPGGAFVRQPSSLHFKFADRLCQAARCEVIVCVYPKIPEHRCSETLSAVADLYSDLLHTHSPDDITVCGDSAGGTVAVLLPDYFYAKSLPIFSRMILFSPMLTVSPQTKDVAEIEHVDPMLSVDGLAYFAEKWCGERSDRNDPERVSLDNFPKTFFFCGEKDILTFYSEKFAGRMKEAEKNYELRIFKGMYHVFPLYPLKASREVFSYVCRLTSE